MNLEQATRAIEELMAADIPTFIWGAPGVGKSDCVHYVATRPQAWADKFFQAAGLNVPAAGLPVIDVRAILLDPVDLRGLPTVTNGRAAWAQPDFLPREDRDGPAGILFLDELNAAPASVQAACFQLVLNRKLGDYVMPKGWRIVAAGNRQGDRAAAQRMPSALANRFAHIDVEPELGAWCNWAIREDINPLVIAFIRFRPVLLHLMPGQQPDDKSMPALASDAKAFPTPRAWAQVAKICDAADDIRHALVASLVGDGPAAEFEGYVKTFRNLPSIADIIANPDKINVPSDPSAQFAIASALARKADRKNFDPILRFAKRALGLEFGIMLCLDATKRDATLKETAAYVAWQNANQDVTI